MTTAGMSASVAADRTRANADSRLVALARESRGEALEVMYGTMKMDAPNRITVASDSGILSVHGVSGKMFFVAMAEKQTAAFGKAVEEALGKAKSLLGET